MEDQQCYIEALKSASATASRAAQAEGNTRASESREAGSGGHRVVELERVIAAMRKVCRVPYTGKNWQVLNLTRRSSLSS